MDAADACRSNTTPLQRILPHRYPFLLVDRITELEPDRRIVGIKNVSLDETLPWRSPRRTRPRCRRPSSTECVAQVGAILILSKPENRDKLILFRGIERVRFRRVARRAMSLEVEARVKRLRSRMGQLEGAARPSATGSS